MDKNDRTYNLFNNYLASGILAVCSLCLIAILTVKCWNQYVRTESKQHIVVVLENRGNKQIVQEDFTRLVDSLNIIIDNHEKKLESKYEALLVQKEKDETLLSAASVIVGIIISILGFFGFKSFHSIEEKAQNIAEEKTKDYLDNNIKKITNEVVNKDLLSKIESTVSSSIQEGIVQKIKGEVDRLEQQSNDIKSCRDQNMLAMKRLDRLEKSWEEKFHESFDAITIEEGGTQTDKEQETENPFEETEE